MRSYRIVFVAMLVCCSLLLTGYSAPRKKVKLPETYQIRNIHAGVAQEHDTQMVRDLCENFRMNEAEVREFFAKADEISAHVREYGYDWLPCYVRGELILDKKKTATWEIQASGTGWIKYPGGKTVHLGCKEACADLFKNK